MGSSEATFRAQFEEERRKVDEARLALVEEKARVAKQLEQQGEKLQQEVSQFSEIAFGYIQSVSAFRASWLSACLLPVYKHDFIHYFEVFSAALLSKSFLMLSTLYSLLRLQNC